MGIKVAENTEPKTASRRRTSDEDVQLREMLDRDMIVEDTPQS
jgi:hypothetical protein